jgi:rubrerythrin
MNRIMKLSLALLIAAMLAAPAAAAPVRVRAAKAPTTRPTNLKSALRGVLDVERQSQAYYRAVLNKHRPLHPFGMVYRVERQHEAALLEEFTQHAIATAENRWQGKEINVPDDRAEALEQAAALEKKTVRAYDKAIAKASGDLKQTLERLRVESRDHQKWFADPESCPRGGGGGGGNVANGGGGRGRGRGGPGRGGPGRGPS